LSPAGLGHSPGLHKNYKILGIRSYVGSGTPSFLYVKFTTDHTLISRGALYNNHLPHIDNNISVSAAHRSSSPSKLCPLTAHSIIHKKQFVSLWSLLTPYFWQRKKEVQQELQKQPCPILVEFFLPPESSAKNVSKIPKSLEGWTEQPNHPNQVIGPIPLASSWAIIITSPP
jgi:hypothetical protein